MITYGIPNPLLLPDGAISNPGPTYSFSSQPDLGFYRDSADSISIAASGGQTYRFGRGVMVMRYDIAGQDGSVGVTVENFHATGTATASYFLAKARGSGTYGVTLTHLGQAFNDGSPDLASGEGVVNAENSTTGLRLRTTRTGAGYVACSVRPGSGTMTEVWRTDHDKTHYFYNIAGANYEALMLYFSSNVARIHVGKGGSGTNRSLEIGTLGSAAVNIIANNATIASFDGNGIYPGGDNTLDLGVSGVTEWRHIYQKGSTYKRAVTVAQLTGNVNDWAIGIGTTFRISSDASRNVTRIAGGTDGRWIRLSNIGAQNIVLQNQNAGSSAANRIITGLGADLTLAADKTVDLWYDDTTDRWRISKNA